MKLASLLLKAVNVNSRVKQLRDLIESLLSIATDGKERTALTDAIGGFDYVLVQEGQREGGDDF